MHLHKPGVNLFKPPLNPFQPTTDTSRRVGLTQPPVVHHLMQRQANRRLTLTTCRKQEPGNVSVSRFPFPKTLGGMYAGQY